MQQAAVSLVSATLQMQKLANSWKSKRFLFVSTAFVHAVPPTSTEALQEKLATGLNGLSEFVFGYVYDILQIIHIFGHLYSIL